MVPVRNARGSKLACRGSAGGIQGGAFLLPGKETVQLLSLGRVTVRRRETCGRNIKNTSI